MHIFISTTELDIFQGWFSQWLAFIANNIFYFTVFTVPTLNKVFLLSL